MGLYHQYLSPRLVDLMCSPQGLSRWRKPCVDGLSGRVVEICFGAGRNVPYYNENVTDLIAIEPSKVMRDRARDRVANASFPIRWGGLDGQRLDLDDASVDAAVVTFSLCTIRDPIAALRELRRVVRPGGELRALEHGIAPDAKIQLWQRRLDGIQHWLADGCHLTRDPVALIVESGWNVTATYQKYSAGPKFLTYFSSIKAK